MRMRSHTHTHTKEPDYTVFTSTKCTYALSSHSIFSTF